MKTKRTKLPLTSLLTMIKAQQIGNKFTLTCNPRRVGTDLSVTTPVMKTPLNRGYRYLTRIIGNSEKARGVYQVRMSTVV